MSGIVANCNQDLTLSELIETSFLKCSICSKHFEDPRLLPCLHSFCRRCIDLIIVNTQSEALCKTCEPNNQENNVSVQDEIKTEKETRSVTLDCPTCKSRIETNQKDSSEFPIDVFLKDLCEMYDYKHDKARTCDYCTFDNKVSKAISLCLDCHDNMCQGCTAAHNRTKVTRGHKVIAYDAAQKGLYDTDIREYQQQMCAEHQEEPLSIFCEKCELPVCKECKVSFHDNHKWSTNEKAVTKYEILMKNLLQGIQKQIPSIYNYITFLSNYRNSTERSREKIVKDITHQAQELHKMVEDQKEAFLKEMHAAVNREQQVIDGKTNNLKTAAESLEDNEKYLRNLLDHGKPEEMLILHRSITQRLTQLTHMQLDGIKDRLRTDFLIGNSTKRNIQTIFGKFSLKHTPIGQTESGLGSSNALQIQTMLPNVKNTVELVTEFDAEGTSEEKEIWPTGLAVTQYDEVVVVDRDNKKVKVYFNGTVKQEISGQGDAKLKSPFDVIVLKSGEIAVTDQEDERIKIFATSGEHLLTIQDEEIKYPRGITINSNGEIIVLDCQLKQMTVHDPKTGHKLRTIKATNESGAKILVDPFYITTTAQDNIIVTDTAAPNLKVFNQVGKYVASYGHYGMRNDEVLQPYGVCCDSYGYIFVADNQNHRVHLLLPDGKFSKFVITKSNSLWHPMGMAISKRGHLIVTEALGKVKIFKYI